MRVLRRFLVLPAGIATKFLSRSWVDRALSTPVRKHVSTR